MAFLASHTVPVVHEHHLWLVQALSIQLDLTSQQSSRWNAVVLVAVPKGRSSKLERKGDRSSCILIPPSL